MKSNEKLTFVYYWKLKLDKSQNVTKIYREKRERTVHFPDILTLILKLTKLAGLTYSHF